jgi:hypothetical protein
MSTRAMWKAKNQRRTCFGDEADLMSKEHYGGVTACFSSNSCGVVESCSSFEYVVNSSVRICQQYICYKLLLQYYSVAHAVSKSKAKIFLPTCIQESVIRLLTRHAGCCTATLSITVQNHSDVFHFKHHNNCM